MVVHWCKKNDPRFKVITIFGGDLAKINVYFSQHGREIKTKKDGQLKIWKHKLNFVEWKLYLHITQVTFISVYTGVTSLWTASGHVITLYITTTVTASFTIQAVCINITPCNICVHYKWNEKTQQKV